jgi:hypothetical protein
MIKPKDILFVGTRQPLGGSKLGNAEKEAVASALIRACQEKNEWKKVRSDIMTYLEQTVAFYLNPEGCKEAMFQMMDEGLIGRGEDKKGQWLAVTTKLLRLLITSTYSGGEKYPDAEDLLSQIPGSNEISAVMDSFVQHSIVNPA